MGIKRDGNSRSFCYVKGLILLLCIIGLVWTFSCTSSTGSSGSSGSGTGSGWIVTVSTTGGAVSSSRGDVLGVIAQVKDRNGSPAPKGTNICLSAFRGGFVNLADTSGLVLVSTCAETTNDIGQIQATYTPLKAVEIQLSDGSFKTLNVSIGPGTDTLSATAQGVTGSTTIQVNP